MFAKFSVLIVSAVIIMSVGVDSAIAESAASNNPQTVPGARVTIEGGVRVIRPAPLAGRDTRGDEAQQSSGAMIYRGAAFYRLPDLKPPRASGHKSESDSD
jgi:hypothetical protein